MKKILLLFVIIAFLPLIGCSDAIDPQREEFITFFEDKTLIFQDDLIEINSILEISMYEIATDSQTQHQVYTYDTLVDYQDRYFYLTINHDNTHETQGLIFNQDEDIYKYTEESGTVYGEMMANTDDFLTLINPYLIFDIDNLFAPEYADYEKLSDNHYQVIIGMDDLFENDYNYILGKYGMLEAEKADKLRTDFIYDYEYTNGKLTVTITMEPYRLDDYYAYSFGIDFSTEIFISVQEKTYISEDRNLYYFDTVSSIEDCFYIYQILEDLKLEIESDRDNYIAVELDPGNYSLSIAANRVVEISANIYDNEGELVTVNQGVCEIETAGVYYINLNSSDIEVEPIILDIINEVE